MGRADGDRVEQIRTARSGRLVSHPWTRALSRACTELLRAQEQPALFVELSAYIDSGRGTLTWAIIPKWRTTGKDSPPPPSAFHAAHTTAQCMSVGGERLKPRGSMRPRLCKVLWRRPSATVRTRWRGIYWRSPADQSAGASKEDDERRGEIATPSPSTPYNQERDATALDDRRVAPLLPRPAMPMCHS